MNGWAIFRGKYWGLVELVPPKLKGVGLCMPVLVRQTTARTK